MGSTRLLLSLCLILFSINIYQSNAIKLVVGGKATSWGIPISSPNELNNWAEKERFKIGDTLVFKYDSKTDSVLEVEEGDYKKCIKTKPIKEYHDGNTSITLNESGAFYFISGANGHCEKGEKLEVKVLSHKHGSTAPSPAASLPPKDSPITLSPPVQTPAESPKPSSVGSINDDVTMFKLLVILGVIALV